MLLAGEVWHYWIAALLVPASIASVIALVVGYLRKVQSLKVPRR